MIVVANSGHSGSSGCATARLLVISCAASQLNIFFLEPVFLSRPELGRSKDGFQLVSYINPDVRVVVVRLEALPVLYPKRILYALSLTPL